VSRKKPLFPFGMGPGICQPGSPRFWLTLLPCFENKRVEKKIGGRNWKIELLNIEMGLDRRGEILEAGVYFFRMALHPAAIGILNQFQVSQLIRA